MEDFGTTFDVFVILDVDGGFVDALSESVVVFDVWLLSDVWLLVEDIVTTEDIDFSDADTSLLLSLDIKYHVAEKVRNIISK